MTEAEDTEAQKLMKDMGFDGDVQSDDEDESEMMDPEEILEKYRRDVTISPDNAIDVIILGTSDLDKSVEDFEAMTGVKPVWVTSMNGAGTKSARVAFESCCYLELIGPDPKQSDTPFSEALAKLPAGEMVPVHYSVRLEKANKQETRMEWKKMGLDYDQVTMVAKDKVSILPNVFYFDLIENLITSKNIHSHLLPSQNPFYSGYALVMGYVFL